VRVVLRPFNKARAGWACMVGSVETWPEGKMFRWLSSCPNAALLAWSFGRPVPQTIRDLFIDELVDWLTGWLVNQSGKLGELSGCPNLALVAQFLNFNFHQLLRRYSDN